MNHHDQVRAKLAASAYSAWLGATYRAFVAACDGVSLVGNFYELPLAERMEWEAKARKAAGVLGWKTP